MSVKPNSMKFNEYYILNHMGEPETESDPILLMKWRNENVKSFSFRDYIGEYTVSTSFVGIKASPVSPPIIWNTTIYGPNDFKYEFCNTNTFSKANKTHRQGVVYTENLILSKNMCETKD
jgi:hypothetical protein